MNHNNEIHIGLDFNSGNEMASEPPFPISLFMVGIAYKYHSVIGEGLEEFTQRLMAKYDLETFIDLEAMLCDVTKRDEILIPGENDPKALDNLHEAIKNLDL